MRIKALMVKALMACCLLISVVVVRIEAGPRRSSPAAGTEARRRVPATGYITGVVKGSNGPEAGVWVIAETADVGNKFRKIVVTDDQGRYLIPELPTAKYMVWVRGYGLVDSQPVQASPGQTVALTAVPAASAREAAEYYPPDSWYSLLQIPAKSEFPLTISGNDARVPGPNAPHATDKTFKSQAEWASTVRSCAESGCHQMGSKVTREVPASIGKFNSSKEAWERLLDLGQVNDEHFAMMGALRNDRGLAMFSNWTDRIAGGEVPPQPPRPEGLERNVVLTVWDFSIPTGFPHDTTTTNRYKPTTNAYGPIYSPDWAAGALDVLDPVTNEKYLLNIPLPNEEDRKKLKFFTPQRVDYPSLFWGDETTGLGFRKDPMNAGPTMMDSKGRVWFNIPTRLTLPDYCKAGSSNPFAQFYPIPDIKDISEVRHQIAGVDYYDPKAAKFTSVDTCFGGGHTAFGNDKDETLYVTARGVNGLGWINTRVWDETHDAEKAQGWCPAVIDYNGDGETGPYTKPPDPPDPKLDRYIAGNTGYIISANPVDGSVWYGFPGGLPGKIFRFVKGDNPPKTCKTEVYEPPFDINDPAKQEHYSPRGIDFDSDGVVWVSMLSGHLASFDRRKCKVLNGPTATGQHCPEGWTFYPVPGPKFKGTDATTDYFYNSWVDRENTFGLGKNVSVVCGTGSDSYKVFIPATKTWVVLRVPYPMGLFTRSLEGRIDDPKAGWKGRGLWGANEARVQYLAEGDKFDHDYIHHKTPFVVHFQIRPDPLTK
jgi:hypothetical protein